MQQTQLEGRISNVANDTASYFMKKMFHCFLSVRSSEGLDSGHEQSLSMPNSSQTTNDLGSMNKSIHGNINHMNFWNAFQEKIADVKEDSQPGVSLEVEHIVILR
jgi:hypothetical protein